MALARALVTRPDVVLADEPTGALDSTTAGEVPALPRDAVDGLGATVVTFTHDPVAAAWADRVPFLADGAVADPLARTTPERLAARMAGLSGPGRSSATLAGAAGPAVTH